MPTDTSSDPLNNQADSALACESVEQQVYADQIRLLYEKEAPIALLWTAILSVGVVFVAWDVLLHWPLLAWLAGVVLVSALRGYLAWRFRRSRPEPAQLRGWAHGYTLVVGCSGLSWGLLALVLASLQQAEQKLFLLLLLTGVMVGALFLLSVFRAAVICFLTMAALPLMASLFIFDPLFQSASLGVGILVLLLGLLATALYLNRVIVQGLRLRRKNQQLLDNARSPQLDPLTGLPNRQALQERLEQAIKQAHSGGLALAYIDIMRFNLFNNSAGHRFGDLLLQEVASRLRQHIKSGDFIARSGSDEFAILLEDSHTHDEAISAAQAILAAMEEPFRIQQQAYYMEVCIGISQYPQDGDSPAVLMRHADQALRRAKRQGRSGYFLFKDQHPAEINDQWTPEQALRRALENNELCLHYQPQIDLFNYTVLGVEALLRWNHPQQGVLSAAQIIPLAEETGLIDPIGRRVLHIACKQAQQWRGRSSSTPFTVSVNVSAQQFLQADLAAQIEQELLATGLTPEALKLEITENLLLPESAHIQRMLRHLKSLGVQLAVDDFGTDYSSLGYLKRFPLDWLKVDRSFVRDIASNPNDAAIVTAMIALAHSLGIKVIAEGIENHTQLAFVQRHHSDAAQGFYIERPMPAEQLTNWLRDPTLPPLSSDGVKRSVLVLEDDEQQRNLLALWLQDDDYQVLLAEDAQQAFAILAQQPVDVMLVDYVLPDIDGIEFMRRVRSIYTDTVRLLISAKADQSALARAINEGGVFRYLQKPFSQEQLCASVREAFTLSRG